MNKPIPDRADLDAIHRLETCLELLTEYRTHGKEAIQAMYAHQVLCGAIRHLLGM